MVAIRPNRASELADAEDHALLEPLANRGAAKKLVSLAGLRHHRDEAVHPVLEELHGHLVGSRGDTVRRHGVHHHLKVHIGLHADAEAVKGLDRVHHAFGGIKRESVANFLVREVVEVLCCRVSHFLLSFLWIV